MSLVVERGRLRLARRQLSPYTTSLIHREPFGKKRIELPFLRQPTFDTCHTSNEE